MQVSVNWLKAFYDPGLSLEALAERLTLQGLEVEGQTSWASIPGELQGVVVGHVKTVEPHPDADKLRVCTVDVGQAEPDGPLTIVCGAANVAAGQKVAVGLVGTTLYPQGGEPLTLKKAKIRGVASHGMICAEDELGLGTSHAGIMVLDPSLQPGTPLAEVFAVERDTILEIGLTPNRGDALSHYGLARDLAAGYGKRLPRPTTLPDGTAIPPLGATPCPVALTVHDTERCPRYLGAAIHGLQVGPSPAWLRQALERLGQRSINNVVDVTNYILLELGQPLHAFDLAHIRGQAVHVRTAQAGSTFTTLDGVERTLNADDLVIADAQGPLCLAGVMGGLASGVTEATTDVFLECAYFHPSTIRQTHRRLDLHTATAYRYARGTDPNLLEEALQRAVGLLVQVAGGTPTAHVATDTGPQPPHTVAYDYGKARTLLGHPISNAEQKTLLEALEITVTPSCDPDGVSLAVPAYRVDVTRFQDVVEEVARLYGMNRVPEATYLRAQPVTDLMQNPALALRNRLADRLAGQGFWEIWTNSLVSQAEAGPNAPATANPLSEELSHLRTSLVPSALAVVAHNLNRQQPNLALFELGHTYALDDAVPQTGVRQTAQLALYRTGAPATHWAQPSRPASYDDLKGHLEALWTYLGLNPEAEPLPATDADLAFGLHYLHQGQPVGRLGQVHPHLAARYGVDQPVFAALLHWHLLEPLLLARPRLTFAPLPAHPAVRRDVSMFVEPAKAPYSLLKATILAQLPQWGRTVQLFDVYRPQDGGPLSYAVGVALQDANKTLTDKAVDKAMAAVYDALDALDGVQVRRG